MTERLRELAAHAVDLSAIVVVDDAGRPLGRILADDIVDAPVSDKTRFQLFRHAPA